MKKDFTEQPWDERDPNPWLALYLDQSTPLPDAVKAAWLHDCSGGSRQFFLPLLRPLARGSMMLIQLLKVFLPRKWAHSGLLHRVLAFSMNRFVSPEANWVESILNARYENVAENANSISVCTNVMTW